MKRLAAAVALAAVALSASAQKYSGGVIDKTIAVVGNEVILISDLEEEVEMMRAYGMMSDKKGRCEVLEEMMASKLFLMQARLDSLTINNDMVGFLEIPGTNIKYPVVQSPYQANYYLRRNFYKRSATCGSLYVREACDVNKPSDNVTIYGHKMTNGTMFAELHKYKKQSFCEDNNLIYFDTLTEYHTYEVFAVFQTEANQIDSFNYHLFDDAKDEAEFNQFINACKALSYYDTGVNPTYGDKLITLSTCDKSVEDGRLVVVARRIE